MKLSIGIEQVGVCLPSSFLSIKTLAEARNIPTEKLTQGLGLDQIAFCAAEESIATLISGAIIDLVESSVKPGSDLQSWFDEVDRIYLGTESSIDGSKPTITYALNRVSKQLGVDIERTDVVDMTFACIGGVDALQICRDYVELNPAKKCIVIAGDIAKYDLKSGGEYTQGAGAIAVLISSQPNLITIHPEYGVSSVHDLDFFKPIRKFRKKDIINDLVHSLDLDMTQKSRLEQLIQPPLVARESAKFEGEIESIWQIPSDYFPILRKEPTYDGKYSNRCYETRILSALSDFTAKQNVGSIGSYGAWLFHLPFSYQGRKTAVRYWYEEIVRKSGYLKRILKQEVGDLKTEKDSNYRHWLKTITKSSLYQFFVDEKIKPSEKMSSRIGNMYTASIFMAMLSHIAYANSPKSESEKLLFLAYGSGSKAKVFSGTVDPNYDREHLRYRLESQLNNRIELDLLQYERLHARL